MKSDPLDPFAVALATVALVAVYVSSIHFF